MTTIGIIGYGFVGQAVAHGFPDAVKLIIDPKINNKNIDSLRFHQPALDAIFVCVPTDDGDDFAILKKTLDELETLNFDGPIIVKSTVLPHVLEGRDIVYNPEFLSRGTANHDFIFPQFLILGGDRALTEEVEMIYSTESIVCAEETYHTDINTACMIKYMLNSFFATKVTYMNQMYDIAEKMGADFNRAAFIVSTHPWFGANHYKVPGHEGRGFAGPCLPKDTKALAKRYDIPLLDKVLELNEIYRYEDSLGSDVRAVQLELPLL